MSSRGRGVYSGGHALWGTWRVLWGTSNVLEGTWSVLWGTCPLGDVKCTLGDMSSGGRRVSSGGRGVSSGGRQMSSRGRGVSCAECRSTTPASLACRLSSRRSSSWNFVVSIGNELKSRPPPFRGPKKSMVRSKRPSKRVRNEFQADWWIDVPCVPCMQVVLSKELLVEFRRFDWKRAQIASTTLSRPEEKHGAIETTIEDGSKRIPGRLVERRPLRPLRAGRPLEGAPRGISSFRSETSSNRVHHPFEARTKAWCGRNDHRRGFETNSRPPGGATSFAWRSSS